MKNLLQITILTRNRSEFLKQTIESVLNQKKTALKYELIISDNSDSDNSKEDFENLYKSADIKYIKRSIAVPAREHFDLVVSELSAEYSVLLHDDDILLPNFIDEMSTFIVNTEAAAVGSNAFIFSDDILMADKKMHNCRAIKRFDNKKEFLERYLPCNGGIAPYPSYMYRTDFLKLAFQANLMKGKHADVGLLTSLLDYGPIFWFDKPLMYYRVHESNDSKTESVHDRLELIRRMTKEGVSATSLKFKLFKIIFWLNWISQQPFFINISNRRYRWILASFAISVIKAVTRYDFWFLIGSRYIKK